MRVKWWRIAFTPATMIIHTPETSLSGDEIILSARIEARRAGSDLPASLWFAFPQECAAYLSPRSDGFAASLLMLAMHFDEPLEVRGAISSRLAYGLQQWQHIFHQWHAELFHPVEMKFERLYVPTRAETAGCVATAFSGGLDSLYAVWSNLPEQQPIPSARVTHALFMHGFDIRLHQPEKYAELYRYYAEALAGVGATLLKARTNAYTFSQFRIKWEYMHGGPLIGAALLLGRLLGRFYVPSSAAYENIFAMGTSPVSDHWLSTETLEIVHQGADFQRLEKMAALQDWPVAQRLLRICTNMEHAPGVNNCGRCFRCMINMIRLELLGVYSKFITFPRRFNYVDILRLIFVEETFPPPLMIIFKAAIKTRRLDIALPVLVVWLVQVTKRFFIDNLFYRLPLERRYRIKRRVYRQRAERG
ncbi:MAG: hypothetical protein PHS96_02060 [Anaerolineales bacterium]|nr:hypothetical protein [Anaerolineales bacterium]